MRTFVQEGTCIGGECVVAGMRERKGNTLTDEGNINKASLHNLNRIRESGSDPAQSDIHSICGAISSGFVLVFFLLRTLPFHSLSFSRKTVIATSHRLFVRGSLFPRYDLPY